MSVENDCWKEVPYVKVRKNIPRGVRKHAAFVVDTTSLGSADMIGHGDDNGSWTGHSKPCRKYAIDVC